MPALCCLLLGRTSEYMHLKSFEGLNILRTIALIGAVAALVLAAIRLMLNRFTVIPLSDRE